MNEISADIVWRNLAVHSAWERSGERYSARGFHRYEEGGRGEIDQWRTFVGVVSIDDINEASEAASNYLKRVAECIEALDGC